MHQELRRRATERRVLVLDDLHRADLPSLHLLRYLTASALDLPLLVIATHRLHELRIDRGRDAALSEIGSRGRRIIPAALGQAEVSSLLAAVVEGERYWAHRMAELDPADADSHDRLVALLQVEGRRVDVEAVQSARRAWLDGLG